MAKNSGGGGKPGRTGGGGDISVAGTINEYSGVDTKYWEKQDVEKEIKKATRSAEYHEKNLTSPFQTDSREQADMYRNTEKFWKNVLASGQYGNAGKLFKGKD